MLALLVLFLTLPSVRTSGDAESILIQHGTGEVLATNPLTSWLQIGLSRLPGLDVREALRLALGQLVVLDRGQAHRAHADLADLRALSPAGGSGLSPTRL